MKISKKTVLEFIGEFIATLILAIFLYTTPIIASGIEPFVIAFLVMVLWQVFSSISKVQMNPAVALGEYIVVLVRSAFTKKFYLPDLFRFLAYIVTQFLAFLAAFPIAAWFRGQIVDFLMEEKGYGTSEEIRTSLLSSYSFANTFSENFTALAFVLEMLMAFLVVFVFIRITTSEKLKQYAGFIWGLVVFAAMIMASQITGASFNPWRSLVGAMFEGAEAMKQVGVYILAPFVGALLAGVLHSVMVWLEKPAVKKAVKVVKKGRK